MRYSRLSICLIENEFAFVDFSKRAIAEIFPESDLYFYPSLRNFHDTHDSAPIDVFVVGLNFNGPLDLEGYRMLNSGHPSSLLVVLASGEPWLKLVRDSKYGCDLLIKKRHNASKIFSLLVDFFFSKGLLIRPLPIPVFFNISIRRRQLLMLLAQGLTNKQIAHELGLQLSTVRAHFSILYKFLNVDGRMQAIKFAFKNGLI